MGIKLEILIETSCLLIILILCTFVYINGKDLSCDKCEIKITQTKYSGVELKEPVVKRYNINELYESLLDKSCILKGDKNVGYIN